MSKNHEGKQNSEGIDPARFKTTIGKKAMKVRGNEAKVIMEDDEFSRIYFWTDKIIFSTCTLLPGQRTPMDPGHSDAHEIVYCMEGNVVFHLPDEDTYLDLQPGDALCLPSGAPHMAINVGENIAKLSWSLAPHIGQ